LHSDIAARSLAVRWGKRYRLSTPTSVRAHPGRRVDQLRLQDVLLLSGIGSRYIFFS